MFYLVLYKDIGDGVILYKDVPFIPSTTPLSKRELEGEKQWSRKKECEVATVPVQNAAEQALTIGAIGLILVGAPMIRGGILFGDAEITR